VTPPRAMPWLRLRRVSHSHRVHFKPRAVSPKGARGLMLFMRETAAQLGVRNVFDVRENIKAGVRHLRY
jgi:membrane-bound lytic murein transglycosylase MltF